MNVAAHELLFKLDSLILSGDLSDCNRIYSCCNLITIARWFKIAYRRSQILIFCLMTPIPHTTTLNPKRT